MRPTGSAPIDKGKGVASASDTYAQTLLDLSEDRLVPDTDRIDTSLRRDSPTNNIITSPSSGEEKYGEHSYYQDAQNSNEDDDSGMSFDSITLYNLDT
ncbi:hypothetical protein H5410_047989 [Solanum commersonii]|uniref:Uncharacterized protein n=1 Tax=Solanum commersonii TaxID=4109 RepID=A0A9J5XGS5_SOLCO|nr:hypothetical protein H5410_047989 [Solanum commersonii]